MIELRRLIWGASERWLLGIGIWKSCEGRFLYMELGSKKVHRGLESENMRVSFSKAFIAKFQGAIQKLQAVNR